MGKVEKCSRLIIFNSMISMIANIAIIGGLIYSYKQYNQIESNNKIQNSIDAVNRVNNIKFIESLTLLVTIDTDTTANEYIDAKNYVLSTYYVVAIIYNSNIANNEIIGKALKFDLDNYVESNTFQSVKNNEVRSAIKEMSNNINLK
jgi:hypothetical protein